MRQATASVTTCFALTGCFTCIYYILLYNGKYYLVGALDGYDNVSFYRMDLMFDLTTKPKESLIKKVDPLTGEIKRVKTPRRKTVEIK